MIPFKTEADCGSSHAVSKSAVPSITLGKRASPRRLPPDLSPHSARPPPPTRTSFCSSCPFFSPWGPFHLLLTWKSLLPHLLLLPPMITNHRTGHQETSQYLPGLLAPHMGLPPCLLLLEEFPFLSLSQTLLTDSFWTRATNITVPQESSWKDTGIILQSPNIFFPFIVKNRTFSNGSILDCVSVRQSPQDLGGLAADRW